MDALPTKAGKEIARAIEADPNCLEVYLALVGLERTAVQAVKFIKTAIAVGRAERSRKARAAKKKYAGELNHYADLLGWREV